MQTALVNKKPAATPGAFPTDALIARAVEAIGGGRLETRPFRHWYFKHVIAPEICREIIALPIAPAPIADTYGKRDSHNDLRRFFSPAMQAQYPVMRAVAEAFQSEPVVRAVEKLCGVKLSGSYLRIEYCQDRDGFWLEPHMDIKEKFITMQLYLNTGPGADTLGTDLYDHEKKHFSSTPSVLGEGMLFVPKEPESWHGFEKRPIPDVRRSLLFNYVTDDWRSRHELSFPDQKVS
jgi:hypothetical protein